MDQPAQNAHVSGNDNIVVQASGSIVTITTGLEPYLRLTQYEKRTKLAARNDSEAGLLSAYRADVVPLLGRDGARADLRAWLDAEAPVSIRVLVGAGGRGKTRLALELARAVAKDGWLAGFVRRTSSTDFAPSTASSRGAGTGRSWSSSTIPRARKDQRPWTPPRSPPPLSPRPHLLDFGKDVAAHAAAEGIWVWIKGRLKSPAGAEAVGDAERDPKDAANAMALQAQLIPWRCRRN